MSICKKICIILSIFIFILLVLDSSKVFAADTCTNHVYQKKVAKEFLKSEATCKKAAVYYKSCIYCQAKSTDTFTYGKKANHKGVKKVGLKYLKHSATCQSAAEYYQSCKWCGKVLKNEKSFTYGKKVAHHAIRRVKDDYLKSAATCTQKAVYYKSCFWCEKELTATFKTGKYGEHSFVDGKCKVCGKNEKEREYYPGIVGGTTPGKRVNGTTLKIAQKGVIKVALRESDNPNTNELLILFPGQDQTKTIIDSEYPFLNEDYSFDIIVVAASSPNDWCNDDNIRDLLVLLDNYLSDSNYTISICGYSAGSYGAVSTAGLVSRKNVNLLLFDGIHNTHIAGLTAKSRLDKLLASPNIKSLKIFASGDSYNIARRTSDFIRDYGKEYSKNPKYEQIDLSSNAKYNKHTTVINYLYDNTNIAF